MVKVAVVGATGAVGQEILRVLERRAFPIEEMRLFASPRSLGKTVSFKGAEIPLQQLKDGCFQGIDIAFFAAGKKISLEFIPQAIGDGARVIDSSSAYRMDPAVPLVIPEVNGHVLHHQSLIASPNCTATMILMAIAPLHRLYGVQRIIASTYQAASGAGHRAMVELQEETHAVLAGNSYPRTVMPHPYAFNLFPHNGPMTSSKYNEEEVKVIQEIQKILEAPDLRIGVTCIRVPILRAHSCAVNAEFQKPITAAAAKEVLEKAPGIVVQEDWERNRFPMPLDASGREEVLVGRVREDLSNPNTLDLWVVGDQLLKGAALNAVQILLAL